MVGLCRLIEVSLEFRSDTKIVTKQRELSSEVKVISGPAPTNRL